jgi:hypothetical protein
MLDKIKVSESGRMYITTKDFFEDPNIRKQIKELEVFSRNILKLK